MLVSSAVNTEAIVPRLCLTLQRCWDTPNLTLFLGFKPVCIAPTAAIPERLASPLLPVIVPFQDVLLAFAFHWIQKTRTCDETNAESWIFCMSMTGEEQWFGVADLETKPSLTTHWLYDLECGGLLPQGNPPQPPQMRISLPRHDLLGEARWPISQRRRAKSLFLSGLLLGSFCTGKYR